MSLINDALKRTKDAQQQNPPPAGGPPLKLAEPTAAKSASGAKTLLYIMVACVVLGNALLFLAIKDRGAKKEVPVAISGAPAPAQPTTATATPAPVVAAPVAAAPSAPPAPVPQPLKTEPVVAVNPAPVAASVVVETNVTEAAAPVVEVQPEPPKPAPLKLQSIIYNPSRPSAMVSSKFVLIGDKVQGFRVAAIDQETVTLIGNGQTNILSLP